ncbi:MAG: hypothetical protein ACOYM8_13985 [Caulobacterales bacterium]
MGLKLIVVLALALLQAVLGSAVAAAQTPGTPRSAEQMRAALAAGDISGVWRRWDYTIGREIRLSKTSGGFSGTLTEAHYNKLEQETSALTLKPRPPFINYGGTSYPAFDAVATKADGRKVLYSVMLAGGDLVGFAPEVFGHPGAIRAFQLSMVNETPLSKAWPMQIGLGPQNFARRFWASEDVAIYKGQGTIVVVRDNIGRETPPLEVKINLDGSGRLGESEIAFLNNILGAKTFSEQNTYFYYRAKSPISAQDYTIVYDGSYCSFTSRGLETVVTRANCPAGFSSWKPSDQLERCRSAFKTATDAASFAATLTTCRAVNRYMDTSAGNLEREAEAFYYIGQILENGFDEGRRKPNEARFQYRKCATLNPRCAAALIQVDAEIAQIIRKAVQSGDAKLAKGDSKGAQDKYWLALIYGDIASGFKLVELKRKEAPDKTRASDGILSVYEALAMAGSDKAVELFKVEIDRRKAVLRELYQEAVNVCQRKTYTQTTRPNGSFVGLSARQQLDLCIERASYSGEQRDLEKRLGNIYALRRGSTGALFPDPVIDAN